MWRNICSCADSLATVAARGALPPNSVFCNRSMNAAASSRVNLPAAWRCVNPIGPRASRKSLWPTFLRRVSRSFNCFADAGGPEC